jgi:3-dehydroquinate synthetase
MNERKNSWHVTYRRPIEYDIVETQDLFSPENDALLSLGRIENARRFIVIDSYVYNYHSVKLRSYFAHHHINAKIVTFPGGEENKSMQSFLSLMDELVSFPIHRRDEPIIAIGGGVLTDLVGFLASSYRRGVPHIKVPTTLMGYVDASVGIKNGINYYGIKNRLGSFGPPLQVLLDKSFLKTLPRRHILNGLCEIVKIAIIKDIELFALLEDHGVHCVNTHFQDEVGNAVLQRAIKAMVDELQHNLFEENLNRKVDFGHTFCYGLETSHEKDLLHGEAVILDIATSVMIARERKLLSEREVIRIFELVERLGIKLNTEILDPYLLWQCVEERTCHRNGWQSVPFPDGLGKCIFINDIRLDEILAAVKSLTEWLAVKNDKIRELR